MSHNFNTIDNIWIATNEPEKCIKYFENDKIVCEMMTHLVVHRLRFDWTIVFFMTVYGLGQT